VLSVDHIDHTNPELVVWDSKLIECLFVVNETHKERLIEFSSLFSYEFSLFDLWFLDQPWNQLVCLIYLDSPGFGSCSVKRRVCHALSQQATIQTSDSKGQWRSQADSVAVTPHSTQGKSYPGVKHKNGQTKFRSLCSVDFVLFCQSIWFLLYFYLSISSYILHMIFMCCLMCIIFRQWRKWFVSVILGTVGVKILWGCAMNII